MGTEKWKLTTLGKVAEYINGRAFKPSEWENEGLPIIRIQNLTKSTDVTNYTQKSFEKRYLVEDDDLLMAWSATLDVFIWKGGRAWLNQHIFKVIENKELITRTFLYYLLKQSIDDLYLKTHGSGMVHITKPKFVSHPILLPSLSEQNRIIQKLDSILPRIKAAKARLEKIPHLLKRFRQSVLADACSGKLTEGWRENLSQMKQPWTAVLLKDIADIKGGITKDSKKQNTSDPEVPYLRVANVQRGFLDLREIKTIRIQKDRLSDFLLEEGDILLNEGGDIDKVGRGWIWESQLEMCAHQNHVFRARLFDKRNQPKFISWWANTQALDYFFQSGKQTTGLASINKTMISNLNVSLPSFEEQFEIVKQVEKLLFLADSLETKFRESIQCLEKLEQAVLAKAFRGELVSEK